MSTISIRVPVDITVDTFIGIRSNPNVFNALHKLAQDSPAGSAVADGARNLIWAVNDLPFDLVAKIERASTTSETASVVTAHPTESNVDEDEDEDEEVIDEEDENEDEDKQMFITLRNLQKQDEVIEYSDYDTFDDVATTYSERVGVPTDEFYFKFEGEAFVVGMNDLLTKNGVTDGAVIEVCPVVTHLETTTTSSLPVPAATTMRQAPLTNNHGFPYYQFSNANGQIHVAFHDTMRRIDNITIDRDASFFELVRRYCERTGLDADALTFKVLGGGMFCVRAAGGVPIRELAIEDGGIIQSMLKEDPHSGDLAM